jgi:hypothetical protein
MPCVWSQVSKKMSMKIPCNFQVRIDSSCATVQTSLWRSPDAPQCIEASALKTSGRQSNTVRTLGQAYPISTRSWISVVNTVWEVSARRLDDVATLPDDVQYYSKFPLQARKGVMAKTVWKLSQAFRTWICYGKNYATLERWFQLTVRTLGQAVWTPSSILIITFCSNIGLGWNWFHWKANKK